MSQEIPLVNELDEIIAFKTRGELSPEDIYRITGFWVLNERGEVLVARRALSKAHDPGKWGPSGAGTVEKGEGYIDNAAKELKEELGLNAPMLPGPKVFVNGRRRFFCQWFFAFVPNDAVVTVQEEEVAEVRWVALEKLRKWAADRPEEFVPSFHSVDAPALDVLGSVRLVDYAEVSRIIDDMHVGYEEKHWYPSEESAKHADARWVYARVGAPWLAQVVINEVHLHDLGATSLIMPGDTLLAASTAYARLARSTEPADRECFEKIEAVRARYERGEELPPLVLSWRGGAFHHIDGLHRMIAWLALGKEGSLPAYVAII